MYTIGFIGTGSMGRALAKAASNTIPGEQILLANRTHSKAQQLAEEFGCNAGSNIDVAKECKFIMLAVKPQMMASMLESISGTLKERKDGFVLVTIAAGLCIDRIQQLAGGQYPVIRIMPNTPCAVGSGTVLCTRNASVTGADYNEFKQILGGAGTFIDLHESLIDAGSAISGCGPAYVFTFIEAMADAGVACGLTRADALKLASSTVLGSADLAIKSGAHPAQLRDKVCSPGGSTIEGVLSLENDGFRAAVANCVLAAFEKTKELGNN